jgi:putative ATP-binding cassette transporter
VKFHLGGHQFWIPGYMVWCALACAGAASWLSCFVGRPLINLNTERYTQEAELRFALVRLNDHIDGVLLSCSEADEKTTPHDRT